MEALAPASPADRDAVVALLDRCGLPSRDVDAHLAHFTVAREAGRLVGVIGVEVHGTDGLLRSLAVAEECRGRGIARRLYATKLGHALRLGIERLYVLTTTAQGFFELLGFTVVPRDEVPESIRGTEEFRVLCPTTACCMVRAVPRV